MSKLPKLLNQLTELEAKSADLGEQISITRNLIIDAMAKEGIKQIKTDLALASMAKRVTKRVNEFEWRAWAGLQPDLELDLFYIKSLDSKRVLDHAAKQLKETGEVVPGIVTSETEYLTIRKTQ